MALNSLDLAAVRQQVEAEAEAVRAVAASLDDGFVEVVAAVSATTGKVISSAVGNSGAVAARLAHVLSLCGTPTLFLDANQALHGSVGAIAGDDLVLVLSKGGVTDEVNEFARLVRDAGATLVVVTESPDAPLAALAHHLQVLPASGAELAGMVGMGSSLAQAAWGDALATALAHLAGLDPAEVVARHPRGLVGKGSAGVGGVVSTSSTSGSGGSTSGSGGSTSGSGGSTSRTEGSTSQVGVIDD